jgi:leucyl-tRNA synthetase
MSYNHQKIESKWQNFWVNKKIFKTEVDKSKPKYYVLDMFPYPSGAGLHVGHVEGYTATDIIARHKRAKGYNVLHPMGWDSFGLPAEQYAIRTGTHPNLSTQINIDTFRRQLKALGFSYDWDREVATSDPSYYKWTQWIFTKLYERGLAYEAEMTVNFCPALGTVLANEEVENGKAKDGGYPIERRPLRQWVLKITAYADRLLQDLDLLDWPEGLKKLQVNWIGRSEGAYITFNETSTQKEISVFTTRPDTLFGATYMVLAPEHPLVQEITTAEHRTAVNAYIKASSSKSDLDRTELNKEKTGVFTGAYAINPINNQKTPIWISDYVLVGYGTGAIMAVPAHDERDFEFATLFNIPIIPVISPTTEDSDLKKRVLEGKACWIGEGTGINSTNKELNLNGLAFEEAKQKVIQWLEQMKKGRSAITYKLRDWLFSRQRYWGEPFPILKFEDGTSRLLDLDELPLLPPEMENYKPTSDGQSPLSRDKNWVEITDPKTGKKAHRETHIMPQWAGSCWYYLRFCDPQNDKEAWNPDVEKYWMNVDMYVGGVEHAVLHLLYARFWHKVLYDCGLVSTLEPFQTLRNQGLIVARSYQNSFHHYVDPLHVKEKNGRFYDIRTNEELTSQIEKMSKSKLNGINPDDILEEFGADTLRLYEMFMGPLEKEKVWNTDALSGCRRFLNRFYDLVTSDKVSDKESVEASRLGHRLVHYVEKDIDALHFNTAIAKMMEFINDFSKLEFYPRSILLMAVQSLASFAPHMAEESWEILGGKELLAYASYPKANPEYLEDPVITYVVQINGKVRGKFDLPRDQGEEVILAAAKAHPHLSGLLEGKKIEKVIFVPNRLLNLVLQ